MGNKALLVLAAGMGSRYGGLKQMDGIGPNGETIIDYSVFDAVRAGFTKVVFVIRESFADEFKQEISSKFESHIEVHHVFQSLETGFDKFTTPADRIKPWGTGHAVLSAKEVISEPFAVINADDFYGSEAFDLASSFLSGLEDAHLSAMVGYILENTLSEHGHVNRGVCSLTEDLFLANVIERTKIEKVNDKILCSGDEENDTLTLNANDIVSMNFWLFHPDIFDRLQEGFEIFLTEKGMQEKSEFYIPAFVDDMIRINELQVVVFKTEESWHGVTYQSDKPIVQNALLRMHNNGQYPSSLF